MWKDVKAFVFVSKKGNAQNEVHKIEVGVN